jgi:hypothetical protein
MEEGWSKELIATAQTVGEISVGHSELKADCFLRNIVVYIRSRGEGYLPSALLL